MDGTNSSTHGCSGCLFYAISSLLLVILCAFALIVIRDSAILGRVERIGPEGILNVCRTLIVNNNKSTEAVGGETNVERSGVSIEKINWPAELASLDPMWVQVYPDKVIIGLSPMYPKLYLIGFAEGVSEYGDRELINGLWTAGSPVCPPE